MKMKQNEKYIGVFDSGIGGLTVVKSIIETMPDENIIYFGDTARVPYGTKSREQITEYALSDARFLAGFDIKAIVIACNTADSAARHVIEKEYTDIPVFGVVAPASKRAAQTTKNGKIGVIATNATVKSGAYESEILSNNPQAEVFSAACPLLVPFVEEGRFKNGDIVVETVLREYLAPLEEKGVDTLVLGCTHYPLLHGVIEEIMPKVNIISSSVAAAQEIKSELEKRKLRNGTPGSDRKYFVSDNPEGFEKNALMFMGEALGGSVEIAAV